MKKPALALLAALSLTACGAPASTVAPAAVATTHGASISTTFATPDELTRSVLEAVERLTGKDVTDVKFSLYQGEKEALFKAPVTYTVFAGGAVPNPAPRLTSPNKAPIAESSDFVAKKATVTFGQLRYNQAYTVIVHAYRCDETTKTVVDTPAVVDPLTNEVTTPAVTHTETVSAYVDLTNADLFRSATQFITGAATGDQDQKAVCSVVTLQDAVFSGNADATVDVQKGDILQPYGNGSTSADQPTSLVDGPTISVKKPVAPPPPPPAFTQVTGL